MKFSFVPLFVFLFAIGLAIGVVAGGLGGVFLWPNPPCPACPVVVCPTPEIEVETEGSETVEAAFHRGWWASCVAAGLMADQSVETVAVICSGHLKFGIDGEYYRDFWPKQWQWPPPVSD